MIRSELKAKGRGMLLVMVTAAALALAGASIALAAEGGKGQAGPNKADGFSARLSVGMLSDADIAGGPGSMRSTGYELRLGYSDFFLSYERIHYNWDNLSGLPFGNGKDDPWGDLSVLRLGFMRTRPLTGKWLYFAGGSIGSAFENDLGDSWTIRAFGGGIYAYSKRLQFMLGAGVNYHKVQSYAIPFIGVSWNKQATQGLSASLGYPVTNVAYRFNPQWALNLRVVGFDIDTFRLADDSPVQREGYLERRDLMAGLRLEWKPMTDLACSLGVFYYFKRELTIHDKDDNNEKTYDVDDAPGAMLRVSYNF